MKAPWRRLGPSSVCYRPEVYDAVVCATVDRQWRQLLGREYELTRRFLLPSGALATFFPYPNPGICIYRVVTQGPEDHVAICDETAERLRLNREDLVIWALDRTTLGRDLAAVFGLQYDEEPLDQLPDVCRIGHYAPLTGYRCPVYLAIPSPNRAFSTVVQRLVTESEGPRWLLVPTQRLLSDWQQGILRSRNVCLFSLEDSVRIDRQGCFSITPGAERRIEEFRRSVLPDARQTGGRCLLPDTSWCGMERRANPAGRRPHGRCGRRCCSRGVQLRPDGHGQSPKRHPVCPVGTASDLRRRARPAHLAESRGGPSEPEATGGTGSAAAGVLPDRRGSVRGD